MPFHFSTNTQSLIIVPDVGSEEQGKLSRVIDLDIDIGADAVDYKYVALPVKN